eukprot:2639317-Rhodomonas_salina.3
MIYRLGGLANCKRNGVEKREFDLSLEIPARISNKMRLLKRPESVTLGVCRLGQATLNVTVPGIRITTQPRT